jgi:hypothetical protein
MLRDKAVLVEPHDVDQLHVDAPAGRGHAHQLTPVSSGRSDARDDHVTAGQNVFGFHPQIGKRRAVHAKELKDSALGWVVADVTGEVHQRGRKHAERLGRRRPGRDPFEVGN